MALTDTGIYKYIFLYLFLFLVFAFPLGRFLEPFFRNKITDFLVYIGSFYLGIMVYALLLIIVIDIFRISNNFFHFIPAFITQNLKKTNQWLVLLVASIAFLSIFIGHLNALHPRVRTMELHINKNVNNLDELNIVMMSDIHLGTVIRNSRLVELVNIVNQLEPDIVLLPGDIVDEDVTPVAEQNMSETLKKIRAKYGVFASTGNHEYIGGVEQTVEYIQKGNIKVLQDEWVKVADKFYIIGRKDMMSQRTPSPREPLSIILK